MKRINKKPEGSLNRRIYFVMYVFMGLFVIMVAYLAFFMQFRRMDTINNSYNPRQEKLAAKVVRGSILAADGDVLARTRVDKNRNEIREYPYGEMFAHVVGTSKKGRMGIENIANISLLTSSADIGEKISNEMADEKNIGDNVITTLDTALQKTAREALGIYKGAVVVMNAATGDILAMVSNPGFDPNTIDRDWDELNASAYSPLMNRAAQGLYPPGSTFKIVTLLEFYRESEDTDGYTYNCKGRYTSGDVTVNCYHGSVHGTVDLKKSFAKSCNSSFANIGNTLDPTRFKKTAEGLLFNSDLPFKLSYKSGSFECDKDSDLKERLHTAIGQGKTLISPLHMALITACIANGGILKKPVLIDRIESYTGSLVEQYDRGDYSRLMSLQEAEFLTDHMKAVVTEGTGSKLSGLSYQVAGKTGSAEYSSQEKGDSHAWFTGFAWTEERDEPIVATVIVEGAGSGSDYAVPMAKRVFDEYFR